MDNSVADKGTRFLNHIIDISIVTVIDTMLSLLFDFSFFPGFISFQVIYFLYYFLMELKYGQTIGKRITKTVIIHREGRKVNKKELLIRTLFRFAVFDVFSFWLGTSVGMHDWFSNTRVISTANAVQVPDNQVR